MQSRCAGDRKFPGVDGKGRCIERKLYGLNPSPIPEDRTLRTNRIRGAVRSVRLCELKQSKDGAGKKLDNGRRGRLRAHDHHSFCTTGSPKVESAPAWRRRPQSTQGAGTTPGAAGLTAGRKRDITGEQSPGKPPTCGGRGTVRSSKKRDCTEDNQC